MESGPVELPKLTRTSVDHIKFACLAFKDGTDSVLAEAIRLAIGV